MKLRTILFCLTLLALTSCDFMEDFDDIADVGIGIDIGNLTNKEYQNLKLHIGGLENANFISTDFFELPTIIVRPNESFSQVVAFNESRWKTDLNKISEISNNAYFAIEFEDGEVIMVKESYESDSLLSFSVVDKNNTVKKKYGGRFILAVRDNKLISGDFFEDTLFK